MSKIITITLNPCIDKSTAVPSLIADTKLRCGETKSEPVGGGTNVSRAIHKLGGNSKAWFLAGGYSGDFFIELMKQKEIMISLSKLKTKQETVSFFLINQTAINISLMNLQGEKRWNY